MNQTQAYGRLVRLEPFPCPICGKMLDITDPLVLQGPCQACYGDWQAQAWIDAAGRLGRILAEKRHERVMKAILGEDR